MIYLINITAVSRNILQKVLDVQNKLLMSICGYISQ